MPLYEYECDACGTRFERIQKFSDNPVEVCPKCGEPKVRKLLSSPAIQFKGSGWYITDYARKGAETETDKPASNEAKSSPTDSSTSSGSSGSTGTAPATPSSKDS